MFSQNQKTTAKRYATSAIILCCLAAGCVSPEAIKTEVETEIKAEIQGVKNDMGELEKVVEQKADNTVVAEQVDEINNKIEQTTQVAEELSVWRKSIEAETINYGGAGWVVLGTAIMACIFLGTGLLLVRAFMRRGRMLTTLTGAIKSAGDWSPNVVKTIKMELETAVKEGKCREQDRKDIGHFAKKNGTFAEQGGKSEV